MRITLSASVAALLVAFTMTAFGAGEVTIYTGTVQWIGKADADAQAQIASDMLSAAGIKNTWLSGDGDMDEVASWVQGVTGDGGLDVLIIYGDFPPTIYPDNNAEPDGSIAETYIESTDGDAIINHADYMFWGLNGRNKEGGLQNMMDIPGIVMWDDDTPVSITDVGKTISPALAKMGDYNTDRPFHLDELAGDWTAEAVLAQNAAGTRADPVIVRDGNRGRLIPCIQTNGGPEPKGEISADIVKWLFANTTAVEPKGKASVIWGGLKADR